MSTHREVSQILHATAIFAEIACHTTQLNGMTTTIKSHLLQIPCSSASDRLRSTDADRRSDLSVQPDLCEIAVLSTDLLGLDTVQFSQ